MFDRRTPVVAALVVVGALFAGSAHASRVNWSVSVNVPPVATVVSNGPVYYQHAPVYVQPAPVYYAPPPVVVYRPGYQVVDGRDHRWSRHHRHHHRDWREERRHRHEHRHERRHEHRDEYGDRWDSRGHR